jgi:putative salt-induced outer membrane protein YdiY
MWISAPRILAALVFTALFWAAPPVAGRAEPMPPPLPAAPDQAQDGVDTGRLLFNSEFDAGANGAHGNAETFDVVAGIKSEGKSDATRIKLDARYYYGSNHDLITRNEYTIGVFNEWFLPETPWSVFVQARYDWSAFESWFGRVSAGTGVGYKFVDQPRITATGRLGAGCVREYGSELTEWRPELLAGGELDWTISDLQKFTADATYFPNLERPRIYRVVSSAAYAMKIVTARGISIKLGVHDEYQSDVDPGFEHNDLKYFASLTIAF